MWVPMPSPYPSLYRNEGAMSNWGLEFAVSATPVVKNGFEWRTDFNISLNRNRLEKLTIRPVYTYGNVGDQLGDSVIRLEVGRPLSNFYGYQTEGIDPETGLVIYKDLDNNAVINDSDKTWIGDANPSFIFGWTNNLAYKGLSLNLLFTGSVGNKIFNVSKIDMIGMRNGANQLHDAVRRWRIPGQITDIPKAGEPDNVKASDMWVEDGSYLKLKNITLSYDITGKWLRKANIARIQPYVTLANFVTFTKYSGYDPEVSQNTDATSMGLDFGTYPNNRNVTFGVNVDF